MAFSQQAACAAFSSLDKQEVTDRVLGLLRSPPFAILPRIFKHQANLEVAVEGRLIFDAVGMFSVIEMEVNPTADFKKDLQLDTLDSVEVMMAAEEEFGVEIPNAEADKISSTAQLIYFIAANAHAK